MFKTIEKIREHRALSKQLRHEHKLIDEAAARVAHDQRIREEVMDYLSRNNLLKDGVS